VKKISVVTMIALASVFGMPRPASAQFMEFIKWLADLDPGGFKGFGYHFDGMCFGDLENKIIGRGSVSIDHPLDQVKADPHTKLKTLGCRNPERQFLVVGLDTYIAWGHRNLEPDPNATMKLFLPVGSLDAKIFPGVEVGVGAGFARFWDSTNTRAATNFVLRRSVGVQPVILIRAFWPKKENWHAASNSTDWKAALINSRVRWEWYSFQTDFLPTDFGAPPVPVPGHGEVIPSITISTGHFAIKGIRW